MTMQINDVNYANANKTLLQCIFLSLETIVTSFSLFFMSSGKVESRFPCIHRSLGRSGKGQIYF